MFCINKSLPQYKSLLDKSKLTDTRLSDTLIAYNVNKGNDDVNFEIPDYAEFSKFSKEYTEKTQLGLQNVLLSDVFGIDYIVGRGALTKSEFFVSNPKQAYYDIKRNINILNGGGMAQDLSVTHREAIGNIIDVAFSSADAESLRNAAKDYLSANKNVDKDFLADSDANSVIAQIIDNDIIGVPQVIADFKSWIGKVKANIEGNSDRIEAHFDKTSVKNTLSSAPKIRPNDIALYNAISDITGLEGENVDKLKAAVVNILYRKGVYDANNQELEPSDESMVSTVKETLAHAFQKQDVEGYLTQRFAAMNKEDIAALDKQSMKDYFLYVLSRPNSPVIGIMLGEGVESVPYIDLSSIKGINEKLDSLIIQSAFLNEVLLPHIMQNNNADQQAMATLVKSRINDWFINLNFDNTDIALSQQSFDLSKQADKIRFVAQMPAYLNYIKANYPDNFNKSKLLSAIDVSDEISLQGMADLSAGQFVELQKEFADIDNITGIEGLKDKLVLYSLLKEGVGFSETWINLLMPSDVANSYSRFIDNYIAPALVNSDETKGYPMLPQNINGQVQNIDIRDNLIESSDVRNIADQLTQTANDLLKQATPSLETNPLSLDKSQINALSIVQNIADNSVNNGFREFTRTLQTLAGNSAFNTKVEFKSEANDSILATTAKNGDKTIAYYDAKNKKIVVNNSVSREKAERAFLHEFVHAMTVGVLSKPKGSLNEAELAFRENMEKLYQKALDNTPISDYYGLSDINEFVAEAFTNSDFQKYLSSIDANGAVTTAPKSIFRQIIDYLRSLISGSSSNENSDVDGSVLEKVLSAGNTFFGQADSGVDYAAKGIYRLQDKSEDVLNNLRTIIYDNSHTTETKASRRRKVSEQVTNNLKADNSSHYDFQGRRFVIPDINKFKEIFETQIFPFMDEWTNGQKSNLLSWINAGAKISDADAYFGDSEGNSMYSQSELNKIRNHMELNPDDQFMLYSDLAVAKPDLFNPNFVGENPIVIVHSNQYEGNTISEETVPVSISLFDITANDINNNADKKFLFEKFVPSKWLKQKMVTTFKNNERGIRDLQLAIAAMAIKRKNPNVTFRKIGTIGLYNNAVQGSYDAYMPDVLMELEKLSKNAQFMEAMPDEVKELLLDKKIYTKSFGQDYSHQLQYYWYQESLDRNNDEETQAGFYGASKDLQDALTDKASSARMIEYLKTRIGMIDRRMAGAGVEQKMKNKEYKLLTNTLYELTSKKKTARNSIRDLNSLSKYTKLPQNVNNDVIQWVEVNVMISLNKIQRAIQDYKVDIGEPMVAAINQHNNTSPLYKLKDLTIPTAEEKFVQMFKTRQVRGKDGSMSSVRVPVIHFDENDAETKQAIKDKTLSKEHLALGKKVVSLLREQMIQNIMHENMRSKNISNPTPELLSAERQRAEEKYSKQWKDGMIPYMQKAAVESLFKGNFKDYWKKLKQKYTEDAAIFRENYQEESIDMNLEIAHSFMGQMGVSDILGNYDKRGKMMGMGLDQDSGELIMEDPAKIADMSMDIELIMDYFMLASKRKIELENNILPILNSAKTLLWNIKDSEGKELPNTIRFLELWKDALIFGKSERIDDVSIMGIDANAASNMILSTFSNKTLVLNLGAALTSALTNTYNINNTAIANSRAGNGMFGVASLAKASAIYASDAKNGFSKMEYFMNLYQVTQRGQKELLENPINRKTKKGLFQSYYGHWMNSMTDYHARGAIMVAQMIEDGLWDAHTFNEETKTWDYDESKDPRFKGKDGAVVREFVKDQMIKDGIMSPDDKKIPIAYDIEYARRLKDIGDQIVGGYDEQTQANAKNTVIGRWFFFFRGYLANQIAQTYSTPYQREASGKRIVVDGEVVFQPEYFEGKIQTLGHMVREMKTVTTKPKEFWENLQPKQKQNLIKTASDIVLFSLLYLAYNANGDDKDDKHSQLERSLQYAYMDLINYINPLFYLDLTKNPFIAANQSMNIGLLTMGLISGDFEGVGRLVPKLIPGVRTYKIIQESFFEENDKNK